MTDAALAQVAERTTVFARTTPAQKTRILLALKQRGHVVGFMGDGINDAPSLHAADVGIAAPHAVDVAREAADILLTERGLGVLHGGILAGRRAFGNVMKYLLMGTSSNFGNMLSMAAASLLLPFLPMLPTQILLNNLLYDVSQITIPTDEVDGSWLRGPHRSDIGSRAPLHDLHRPDQLRLRLSDVLRAPAGVSRRPRRSFTPAGSSSRSARRRWCSSSSAPTSGPGAAGRAPRSPRRCSPSSAFGAVLPVPRRSRACSVSCRCRPCYFAFVAVATVAYLALVEVAKRALVRRGTLQERLGVS